MPRSLRTLCLLALLAPVLVSADDEAWRSAEPGWNYEFPRDHGPHREFKTEWWYATGNLRDDQGREYGFQLTFFRQGIHPGIRPADAFRFRVYELPFAHFAMTDITAKTFRNFQRSSRGAFGEAGFGIPSAKDSRMAWMDDWLIEQKGEGRFHLKASESGRELDLTLEQDREPLLHGQDGISPKSSLSGHASHYYSLTRMKASGSVTIDGKTHAVSGLVWFDHEWATNSLDPGEAGWDWSGLHLSNGDDLMLFRIRNKEGKSVFLSGTLRDAKGNVTDLSHPGDILMTPQGLWKSPHTGGLYPAGFDISIPSRNLKLHIEPKLADQELLLPPFAYWEGAVKGNGSCNNGFVTAEGYLELTGYGGKILGLSEQ